VVESAFLGLRQRFLRARPRRLGCGTLHIVERQLTGSGGPNSIPSWLSTRRGSTLPVIRVPAVRSIFYARAPAREPSSFGPRGS